MLKAILISLFAILVLGCSSAPKSIAGTFNMVPNKGSHEMDGVAPMKLVLLENGKFEIHSGTKMIGEWKEKENAISLTLMHTGEKPVKAGAYGSQQDLKVIDGGNTLVPSDQELAWQRATN